MLEKPAQELLVAERHHTALAVMRIILPSKRYVSVGHLYKSMVGVTVRNLLRLDSHDVLGGVSRVAV